MLNILINGYLGNMGQAVAVALNSSNDFNLIGCIDINSENTKNTFKNFKDIPVSKLESADCLVDFTNSSGLSEIAEQVLPNKIPLVSGSTGYSTESENRIRELSSKFKVGVALCSNFSTGAILLGHLGKIAADFYDYVEIIESHHENKLDAPSGTSISLAKSIASGKIENFNKVDSKVNKVVNTRGGEAHGISIHSIRTPGVIAKHELIFAASGETVNLVHNSSDRASFMPGVLKAIKHVNKNPKFTLGLEDILGL